MIKDILVLLPAGMAKSFAGQFALSAASLFDAHLSALTFAYDPPIGGSILDGVTPAFLDTWRNEKKAEAETAMRVFNEQIQRSGVRADVRIVFDEAANAARTFGALCRNYDISIVAQAHPDDDTPQDLMIDAALFDSGRPLLLVPYIQKEPIKLDRVMVCWDGSRNAARAVADAMPMLRRAGHIDLVTIEHTQPGKAIRGAQMAEHLARHKLPVQLTPIVAPDSDAANVILSRAADNDTSLIVMGGYGHTRLREFVLGGATRSILSSMTVPVLMSH